MLHSRKSGPGRKSGQYERGAPGSKVAQKCILGVCTLKGYSMYGQDLMSRFYNKRFIKGGFEIKVM